MSAAADCRTFRSRLEGRLVGRAQAGGLGELSWHRHLFECAACRALLEREEALEILLASLPEPHLPHDLAQRVLARLRRASEGDLDLLLELDDLPLAPPDLAARVLAGLAGERRALPALTDQQLEVLLEPAGAVDVPADLAERVLAGLERHRGRPIVRTSFARGPFAAAAAGLLVAAGLWVLWPVPGGSLRPGDDPVAHVPALRPTARSGAPDEPEPELELLALLDLLAEDLLWDDGVGLDLVASISLAGREELLLEFGAGRTTAEPAQAEGEDPDEG